MGHALRVRPGNVWQRGGGGVWQGGGGGGGGGGVSD